MPGQQTFDPNEFFVNFLGIPVVQFAKGTFVTITFDSDAFVDDVGAKGNVVRVAQPDYRATVKFTLQAASPSNDILSDALQTDRSTGGDGTGALMIKDGRGTTVMSSAQAWVKKNPDQTFSSSEPTTRDWEIRCAALVGTVGGTNVL